MDLKNQTQKRNIKFRALKDDISDFRFVYGNLIYDHKDNPRIQEDRNEPTFTTCIKGTECQFTGLTDINGKEIYEGDIVRWGMHGGSLGHETWNRYAEVEINPDLQFRIIHYIHSETGEKRPTDNYIFHFGKFAYTETKQFLEIIGNVFENPELLKTVSSKNKA